jgi:hypothetical protein
MFVFQGYLLGSLGLMVLGGGIISILYLLSSSYHIYLRGGNLECESVHSFNGAALGLVLYAFWIFDLQKG